MAECQRAVATWAINGANLAGSAVVADPGPNWHAIFRHPFSKHERANRDLGDEWGGHRKRRGHYNFSKPTTSVAIILNTAKLLLTPNSLGSGTR